MTPAERHERDEIIAGFSDWELLRFRSIGGTVPRHMVPRADEMLRGTLLELDVDLSKHSPLTAAETRLLREKRFKGEDVRRTA